MVPRARDATRGVRGPGQGAQEAQARKSNSYITQIGTSSIGMPAPSRDFRGAVVEVGRLRGTGWIALAE